MDDDGAPGPAPWWRRAVIYQVYLRSFADVDGDGMGDIAGILDRLPHLRRLGVDAIWVNPWYVSPQVDAGYDVEDYRAIDPLFGTLADAEELVAAAHAHGIRVVPDIVPNHTSDRHPWFTAALAGGPGAPERARYVFRPGRGPGGDEPPTNWESNFGGPAWTRITEAPEHGGGPGPWYLHLFAPGQPDLDWAHPDVAAEFESVLRFWFDRGVDGFRVDVAHGLVKDPALPDVGDPSDHVGETYAPGEHPFWDRDGVHEVYRAWRRVADEYPGDRTFVAEAWTSSPERLARYVRPDELHTAFNFDFLRAEWDAGQLRAAIDTTRASLGPVGAPATWVLSNHDVVRHVSRYGRTGSSWTGSDYHPGSAVDVGVGRRRARAALLLEAALPGGFYVYQGEELGLEEVDDLPEAALQDPTWERSGHTDRGRDGCRVPLPWSGDAPPFGFGPPGTVPWLPQPEGWASRTVQRQSGDPDSVLELYRATLALRRELRALEGDDLTWLGPDPVDDGPGGSGDGVRVPEGVLAFRRGGSFVAVVNVSDAPVALPVEGEVLLASGPPGDPVDGVLPPDTAVWLRTGER